MRENYKKLTLRLTEAEYAHLQGQAEAAGLKFEPLLRKLILGLNIRPRPPDDYAALRRELSAIGNNVNQIAYWANANCHISPSAVREVHGLLERAWKLLLEKL